MRDDPIASGMSPGRQLASACITLHFVCRLSPPHPLDLPTKVTSLRSRLRQKQNFFAFLKTPQRNCRKLLVVGGYQKCVKMASDIPDGSKVMLEGREGALLASGEVVD